MQRNLILPLTALLLLPQLSVAAQPRPALIQSGITGCDFVTGKLTAGCIPQFLGHIIGIQFAITGAVFLIVTAMGGYQYVLGSAGVGQKENGLARIRFGMLGFLVSALAFFIVDFVITTLAT